MSRLRATFFLTALVAVTASAPGQTNLTYAWRTFSGQPGGVGNSDGPGSAARFWYPSGVAVDSTGNLYVADAYNNTIRKVTSGGIVTTLAGRAGEFGTADGSGDGARFSSPSGVAVDSVGNLYVADAGNSTIRKVTSGGAVTTLAGSPGQPGNADGTGGAARFDQPNGVAVDNAGNVYVADAGNSTVRKVTSSGVVTTLAGSAGESGSADGTNGTARFYYPSGLAVDSTGNVYVADTDNHTIRKVTGDGVVTTLAGSVGETGSADGTGGAAQFYYPSSVALDSAGNVYVADTYNSTIRKITSGRAVTTLAGNAGLTGGTDGTGSAARFYYPAGAAVDSAGNVYVADTDNNTIRKVTGGGIVTTLAGSVGQAGSADAAGSMARFNGPVGVTVTGGALYVADSGNSTIRKVTSGGLVATLAGSPGQTGSADGAGSTARFASPYGVVADSTGTLYVADSGNATIRKVTSGGVVTTLAGSPGQPGSADGTGSAARFGQPVGVTLDGAGNLYVADFGSNTIRKVTSGGVVTTLAGSPGQPGSADGTGSAARFNGPVAAAVDPAGNVYVADSQNKTIRMVTSNGVVTTLAGSAGQSGSADGAGSAARFAYPFGVALDTASNLYVADAINNTIRKVTSAGVVTTLAGSPGLPGTADGAGSAARFYLPAGAAVDLAGNVFVADLGNHTLRKMTSGGAVTTLAGRAGLTGSVDVAASSARFSEPSAVAVDKAGALLVADAYNHTIRKVTPDGAVTTLAGSPGQSGSQDGTGPSARFWSPAGVAVDVFGNVYVADSFNSTIRKVAAGGAVTTVAGSAGQPGSADGTGSAARFSYPSGVASDTEGDLYVTDFDNSTLRKVTSLGAVTTLAGSPGQPGSADGPGSAARFANPNGVALDSAGNLYMADSGNSTVRKVTGDGVVTTLAGSAGHPGSADGTGSAARFDYPFGVAVDQAGNVYVADAGNSTIRMVNSHGVVTTIGGTTGIIGGADGIGSLAAFAGPRGVAVDDAGRLFIADAGNNRISRGVRVPTLGIYRTGSGIVVSWPSPSPGFALQEGSGNPNGWAPSGSAISDDGTNKTITVAPPVGTRFFRLVED